MREIGRPAGAGMLLAFLALWAGQGVGGEVVMSREVVIYGQDLAGQLAQPVAEMQRELTHQGCNQFSLAFWSVGIASQLRVEVRCLDWRDPPLDSWGAVGRASHESTVAGPSR